MFLWRTTSLVNVPAQAFSPKCSRVKTLPIMHSIAFVPIMVKPQLTSVFSVRYRELIYRTIVVIPDVLAVLIAFSASFRIVISNLSPPMSLSRSITFARRSIRAVPAVKYFSISSSRFLVLDTATRQTSSLANVSLFISRLAFQRK